MNNVNLLGRLTRDPDVRRSAKEGGETVVARYTLAVDRRFARANDEQQTADFISCVCFGKSAEFAEKYLKQGTKIAIRGRIQTGSYTNKEGQKVYTTDVVVEEQEFAESKNSQNASKNASSNTSSGTQGTETAGNAGSNDDEYINPNDILTDVPFPL